MRGVAVRVGAAAGQRERAVLGRRVQPFGAHGLELVEVRRQLGHLRPQLISPLPGERAAVDVQLAVPASDGDARAGKPVCAVRPPGFFAPADCTREAACGVMDVRRAPVPLLLLLLFPMPIASSSSMVSIGPGRHRVFEVPCSLTSTNGSIKGPVKAGSAK